jgi:hypothetical protein
MPKDKFRNVKGRFEVMFMGKCWFILAVCDMVKIFISVYMPS